MRHNKVGIWRRIKILHALLRYQRRCRKPYMTLAQIAERCSPAKPRCGIIKRDSTYVRRMVWTMYREGLIRAFHRSPRRSRVKNRFTLTLQGANWLRYQLRSIELYRSLSPALQVRMKQLRPILGRKPKTRKSEDPQLDEPKVKPAGVTQC